MPAPLISAIMSTDEKFLPGMKRWTTSIKKPKPDEKRKEKKDYKFKTVYF